MPDGTGRFLLDVPAANRWQLLQIGAQAENVWESGLCTYAEPERFFSYRRSTHRQEPDYGRHINAIALAG